MLFFQLIRVAPIKFSESLINVSADLKGDAIKAAEFSLKRFAKQIIECLIHHNKMVLSLALLALLSGCSTIPSSIERQSTASHLADINHWHSRTVKTTKFDLLSFRPIDYTKAKLLTIYIEGDGLAWLTKRTVSSDPTPVNPLGFKLALNHFYGNAVYLARPCQYTGGTAARNCNKHYWTDSRFSEEVVAATNEAISNFKAEFKAEQLQLVGYSGGAAVAALLAARRNDVVKLITVAGNIDHRAWTAHHKISPLTGSLNPADYKQKLAHIEQIHFVGSNDKVIPPFLAKQFVADFSDNTQSKVVVVPNQKHGCCWSKAWRQLLQTNL